MIVFDRNGKRRTDSEAPAEEEERNGSSSKRTKIGDTRQQRLSRLSQNPKSSFEEDLTRLSQEVRDLKEDNAEKDQHWARPELPNGWDPDSENLIFQQIDCEEGTLDRKATIRLFGVTEVF